MSMEDIELPDLPEPFEVWGEDEPHSWITGYTAEQMRAYAIADREKRAQAAQHRVPDAVWEALQRMIEDGLIKGEGSRHDAMVVQRWRAQFVPAREEASKPVQAEAPTASNAGEPTDAMIDAYLTANDAYWREVDALPHDITKPWRQGTPKEATRVSLRAALAQVPEQVAGDSERLDWLEQVGTAHLQRMRRVDPSAPKYWDVEYGPDEISVKGESLRAAIDAARTSGEAAK